MNAEQSKKVAIYCRVSMREQSVEMQLNDLRRYCQARAWEPYKEYQDEGVSGSKESRPALDNLMRDARQRLFDVIVVWRFDRFARSSKHLAIALDEFRGLGIDFVSFQEQIDTSSPMGKMVFSVMAAVAELERSIITERVRAGVRRARQRGKVFGRRKLDVSLEKALTMQRQGYSVRKMAMALGVTRSTVHNRLKELSKSPMPVLMAV